MIHKNDAHPRMRAYPKAPRAFTGEWEVKQVFKNYYFIFLRAGVLPECVSTQAVPCLVPLEAIAECGNWGGLLSCLLGTGN